jgi:predicted enzyme related to lactoylglutathione lyase
MSAPALTRIAQIAIVVTDLERAIAFYRDVLGLQFLFQAPPGLAFFNLDGVRIMLSLPEGETGSTIVYYQTADIHATTAAMKSRGASFESEPHKVASLGKVDLWMAFCRDSEGNMLGVLSEVPN